MCPGRGGVRPCLTPAAVPGVMEVGWLPGRHGRLVALASGRYAQIESHRASRTTMPGSPCECSPLWDEFTPV